MNSPILSPLPADVAADVVDTRMGTLLVESGKLTAENAERVLRMHRELGIRYGEAAMRLGLVSDDDIRQMLARQFGYPYVQPGEASLSPRLVAAYAPFSPQVEALRAIRSQLMLRWFARGRRALAIAGADPDDGAAPVRGQPRGGVLPARRADPAGGRQPAQRAPAGIVRPEARAGPVGPAGRPRRPRRDRARPRLWRPVGAAGRDRAAESPGTAQPRGLPQPAHAAGEPLRCRPVRPGPLRRRRRRAGGGRARAAACCWSRARTIPACTMPGRWPGSWSRRAPRSSAPSSWSSE